MRCLTIGWVGVSQALESVKHVLEQYGHRSGDEAADWVIEDGSQPVPRRLSEASASACAWASAL